MKNLFLFPLSKLETGISNFSFYSRNPRSEFYISLSTLEIRDQNLVFLFLLSKFETRISNFSFYSRNSRSEFQISLSTLEFTFFDSRQCLVRGAVGALQATLSPSQASNPKYPSQQIRVITFNDQSNVKKSFCSMQPLSSPTCSIYM